MPPACFGTCPFQAEELTALRKKHAFLFWLYLTWSVCPPGPPGQVHVLVEVAEKHEVVRAKSVQASPAATHMHTHLALQLSVKEGGNLPWGKEKRILHIALQRAVPWWKDGDEHVGSASKLSSLLFVHELLWAPWPPPWNYDLFLTKKKRKQHHRFPRRLKAILLVLSDKQMSIHNFSPRLSIVSAREHVPEVGASLKALSAYNLLSNAFFLFKFCKMEKNPYLSSVDSSVGSETN